MLHTKVRNYTLERLDFLVNFFKLLDSFLFIRGVRLRILFKKFLICLIPEAERLFKKLYTKKYGVGNSFDLDEATLSDFFKGVSIPSFHDRIEVVLIVRLRIICLLNV
jgi:hypothetical protein